MRTRGFRKHRCNPGNFRGFALMEMREARLWNIPHFMVFLPEPTAPIHIFKIEKEALIHKSHRVNRTFADHNRGAQEPVHCLRFRVVRACHAVASNGTAGERQNSEYCPTIERNEQVWKMETRILKRSVGVREFRPHCRNTRMPLQKIRERFQRATAHDNVGVHNKHILPARMCDADIIPMGKPSIRSFRKEPHIGKQPAYHIATRIRRCVVNDQHFIRKRKFCRNNTPKAIF